MKKFYSLIAILAFMFISTKAHAIAEVEVRYWDASLAMDAQVSTSATLGSDFDFINDLGMDEKAGMIELRAKVGFFGNNVRYAFTNLSWEGNDNVTKSIIFDGVTYTAGLDVKSEISIDYHRLGVEFGFELLGNQLGIILEAKLFDVEMTLNVPSNAALSRSDIATIATPAVGATFNINLPFLISFGGEVTGMELGSKLSILDAEVAFHFDPGPFMTFSLGYRVLEITGDDGDDNTVNMSADGPFARLEVGF